GDFMNHPDVVDIDPFRLPIDITSTGLDGHAVRKRLTEDFDIFAEMATATTIVALIGVGKRPDLSRLFEALDQMRFESADPDRAEVVSAAAGIPSLPSAGRLVALPRDAYFADSELVPAAEAIGRTSVSSLAAYPPGIPNVLPGEEITAETVEFLQAVAASPSGHVRGAADPRLSAFWVLKA
ncbi:MAG: amino acid decarboxylase, partial [Brevibacterium sp.]|nr:amino acid decarboxylase [Brevibacterium sp.]